MEFINERDLEYLLEYEPLFILKFTAGWCLPCKQLDPVLESISEYTEIPAYQIDVDDNYGVAMDFAVLSVPTTFLFDDGTPLKCVVGAHSKEVMINELGLGL